jgi:hypothetical protein
MNDQKIVQSDSPSQSEMPSTETATQTDSKKQHSRKPFRRSSKSRGSGLPDAQTQPVKSTLCGTFKISALYEECAQEL